MTIELMSIEEIKKGITFDDNGGHVCTICGEVFEQGEIFAVDGRYYEPEKAASTHISKQHGDRLTYLLRKESKYVTLTENQKQLLGMMSTGMPDSEIADILGVAQSTVRHQRFVFREKAKQAKMYLAMYELALENENLPQTLIPVHDEATMLDDRFNITEKERKEILSSVFSSLKPLKLLRFPPKEKKKIVILNEISKNFKKNIKYTEKEINAIIKGIYDDFVTIRRYLIEYGYLDRTRDGSEYWVK